MFISVQKVKGFFGSIIGGGSQSNLSHIADGLVEVFSPSNIDDLATGGVITVADGENLTIDLKTAEVESSTEFVLEGSAELRFTSELADAAYLYSGPNIMIDGDAARVSFENVVLVSTSTGTFYNVVGSTLNIQLSAIFDFDDLGSLSNGANFVIHQSAIEDCGKGFTVENMDVIDLNSIGLNLPAMTGNFIEMLPSTDRTGDMYVVGVSGGVGSNAVLGLAPNIKASSLIDVSHNPLDVGGLFDTSGGATGTFTAVADAAISAQSVASVTDSSGIARFNWTPGPTVFVGQEVIISGYTTNTAYNGTFLITAAGAGFFEVSLIPFGTDEATGSFDSDSITLTEVGTALVNGDALVIDTDFSTDYDGGNTVYNKLTNSFQINGVFTTTHTGGWDTSGIDESDPRVLANNNPRFKSSGIVGFGEMNGNATATTVSDGTYAPIDVSGFVDNPISERLKLVDATEAIYEYTGNEPCSCFVTAPIWATKSGATGNYRFAVSLNGAVPVFATAPYTPMEVKTTKVGTIIIEPVQLVLGDRIQVMGAGDGTGDDPTITDFKLEIK